MNEKKGGDDERRDLHHLLSATVSAAVSVSVSVGGGFAARSGKDTFLSDDYCSTMHKINVKLHSHLTFHSGQLSVGSLDRRASVRHV